MSDNDALAAVLSAFVPGLGQLKKKQWKRAIVMFVMVAFFAVAGGWLIATPFHAIQIIDAYTGNFILFRD